ncbi:MAG: hypothetical protein QOC64_1172, partial [Solirubrobacteraceae bacterium]|nr:hypothetical protein [Solirubrobacteraceae bacterium]
MSSFPRTVLLIARAAVAVAMHPPEASAARPATAQSTAALGREVRSL